MDLHKLSQEELNEKLETFGNRIETLSDYINDFSDPDQVFTLRNQLENYKKYRSALKGELKSRSLNAKYSNINLSELLNNLKDEILGKLDLKDSSHRYMYQGIKPARDFDRFLNCLNMDSQHFYNIDIMTAEFFKNIPDELLIKHRIYINKENIIQETDDNWEFSIFINSKSVHKNKSCSYHYGKCKSVHYDSSESYHHNESHSVHYDKSKSIHFDNTTLINNGEKTKYDLYHNAKVINKDN